MTGNSARGGGALERKLSELCISPDLAEPDHVIVETARTSTAKLSAAVPYRLNRPPNRIPGSRIRIAHTVLVTPILLVTVPWGHGREPLAHSYRYWPERQVGPNVPIRG